MNIDSLSCGCTSFSDHGSMLRGWKELQTNKLIPSNRSHKTHSTRSHSTWGYHIHMWVYDSQTLIGQHPLVFLLYFFPPPTVCAAGWWFTVQNLFCGKHFSSNYISGIRISWSSPVYHHCCVCTKVMQTLGRYPVDYETTVSKIVLDLFQ